MATLQRFLRPSYAPGFFLAFAAISARDLPAQTCFETLPVVHVGGIPVAIESADLNGDGKLDLITLLDAGRLSISLNAGAGTFQAPAVITIGSGLMQEVTCADLDGDGDVDLAVAADGLYMLLNQGGGTFPGASQVAVGSIQGVTHGDLDGDGDIDLVTGGPATNAAVVHLNLGGAIFATGVPYLAGQSPSSPVCADVDGDLDLDIIMANRSTNSISVFLNAGNGTFGPSVAYTVALNPVDIATGDFDLDGDVDLAVASSVGVSLTVLANQGNGTFVTQFVHSNGASLTIVRSGDLNGDGYPEWVLAGLILDNLGTGSFAARPLPNLIGGLNVFAIADLDGDGDADLAAGGLYIDRLVTAFNRGDGTFLTPVELTGPTEPASGLAQLDFDGDGDLDLAVGREDANVVQIFEKLGSGSHQLLPAAIPVPGRPSRIESADFDGDGDADLATVTAGPGGYVVIALNQGQGVFVPTAPSTIGNYQFLECADFDGDADIDVMTWGPNGWLVLMRNDGTGTLAPPQYTPAGTLTRSIESLDFDGDGDVDIAGVQANPMRLMLYTNQGGGTFLASVAQPLPTDPADVKAADLDADGDMDLAVTTRGAINVLLLWNSGVGSFSAPVPYPMPFPTVGIGLMGALLTIADWDGDGDLDVEAANETGIIGMLENQGSGLVFNVGPDWMARTGVRHQLANDFDGDGDLDLVYLDQATAPVRVLLNCRLQVVSFCAGDGTSGACPCGNFGASGHGCANSSFASGAQLGASGHASLSNDSVVLSASGTPDGPGMFIQSDGPTLLPFGDGLLCAGAQIRRLAIVFAVGGASACPNSTIQTPLHVLGNVQVGGVARHYQLFYRDGSPSFCTPATFNTTNGVTLTWVP